MAHRLLTNGTQRLPYLQRRSEPHFFPLNFIFFQITCANTSMPQLWIKRMYYARLKALWRKSKGRHGGQKLDRGSRQYSSDSSTAVS